MSNDERLLIELEQLRTRVWQADAVVRANSVSRSRGPKLPLVAENESFSD
jgi:hypothetical protein